MTIHMSQKWPEMVVEPDMCSHFYIESVYTTKTNSLFNGSAQIGQSNWDIIEEGNHWVSVVRVLNQ